MTTTSAILLPLHVGLYAVLRNGDTELITRMEETPQGRAFHGHQERWTERGTNMDSGALRDHDVIGVDRVAVWKVSCLRWAEGSSVAREYEVFFYTHHGAALAFVNAHNLSGNVHPDDNGWCHGAKDPELVSVWRSDGLVFAD